MAAGRVFFALLVGLSMMAYTYGGSLYVVGGLAGWDMSTDLTSWVAEKNFVSGDVLNFQFSKYYDLNEVTKEGFDSCNSSNAIYTTIAGNASIALSKPGPRYFICGVRLYCFSGMKLQVSTTGDVQAGSPVPAPSPYSPSVYQSPPQPLLPRSTGSPTGVSSSAAAPLSSVCGIGVPIVYLGALWAVGLLSWTGFWF